jgi:hypothetical protein
MPWRFYALGLLCLLTVTACAQPAPPRSAVRYEALTNGKISAGACDDAGQFIPGDHSSYAGVPAGVSLEASAAPSR